MWFENKKPNLKDLKFEHYRYTLYERFITNFTTFIYFKYTYINLYFHLFLKESIFKLSKL